MVEQFSLGEDLKVEPMLLQNSRVSLEITPVGAFVNSLIIDGGEIIFSRKKENPKRGGIPVLGPTPGPVSESEWSSLYPNMPQHGTDRWVVWKVDNLTDTKATFERIISPKEFLFNGRLMVEIELKENGMQLSKSITNFEDKPREIGSAFHPYFSVDKNTKFWPEEISSSQSLKPRKSETVRPGVSVVKFNKGNSSYEIVADPNPTITVVWSDNPNLYICVEPWWAEKGKGDIVGPGETKKYSLTIKKIKGW